jgi:hypothetical protein
MVRAALIGLVLLTGRAAVAQTAFSLSQADYVDRVTAIWLAQMIGQTTGVRFEHRMAPAQHPARLRPRR